MTGGHKVVRLGVRGDGITSDGVIVPRALPGETVSGELDGTMLSNVRILEPSPDRVKPICRHFKTCGGCQVQHGSDELVARWKREVVKDHLTRRGLRVDVSDVVTSPIRSRRRAGISARRTKSGAMAGFHMRESDALVDVQDCPVLSPTVQAGLDAVRALAVVGASRKAEITAHVTETLDGLDVVVSGGKALDGALNQDLPRICSDHGIARLTWDGELVAQASAPRVRLGAADVIPPPGAFLQATEHGQKALQETVINAVSGAKHVADLFAGCGTFALSLANHGPVHAVESEAAMISALDHAARHAGLAHPIATEVRDLFSNPLLPSELADFDAVVLDPPRAGAAAQIEHIVASDVNLVAYVSCDPMTFARDVEQLVKAGFACDQVQVVDQFRWSAHIELAATLRRSHMQG